MRQTLKYLLVILTLFSFTKSFAQLDTLEKRCARLIQYPFISDGQEYRALVTQGQTAEFHVTFYGNATYRIAILTGDGSIAPLFRLYDKDGKLLFSSQYYNYPKYWDFKFTSTIEAVIDAQLPPDGPQSGIIIMYIGFK